jgi:hypothetical protein
MAGTLHNLEGNNERNRLTCNDSIKATATHNMDTTLERTLHSTSLVHNSEPGSSSSRCS